MSSNIPFFKYQGAGNDFVIIDQRQATYLTRKEESKVAQLCHRRFGIGADGLILLQNHPIYDFEMVYFNADGREGTLCGNGSRCIVAFAHFLELIGDRTTFWAADGAHEARAIQPNWIELRMHDIQGIEILEKAYFLDTGSPHYVRFVPSLAAVDVVEEGRSIRNAERFKAQGTNVNFVEALSDGLRIATYERGVEDETLACGTGITAAAITHVIQNDLQGPQHIPIQAKGGQLEVRLERQGDLLTNIWLCGPAEYVFEGKFKLPPPPQK